MDIKVNFKKIDYLLLTTISIVFVVGTLFSKNGNSTAFDVIIPLGLLVLIAALMHQVRSLEFHMKSIRKSLSEFSDMTTIYQEKSIELEGYVSEVKTTLLKRSDTLQSKVDNLGTLTKTLLADELEKVNYTLSFSSERLEGIAIEHKNLINAQRKELSEFSLSTHSALQQSSNLTEKLLNEKSQRVQHLISAVGEKLTNQNNKLLSTLLQEFAEFSSSSNAALQYTIKGEADRVLAIKEFIKSEAETLLEHSSLHNKETYNTLNKMAAGITTQNLSTKSEILELISSSQNDLKSNLIEATMSLDKNLRIPEDRLDLIEEINRKLKNIERKQVASLYSEPPIIVGGCGRSGTTLLLSILSAHPHINALPDETGALSPGAWDNPPLYDTPFNLLKLNDHLIRNYKPGHTRWAEKTPKNVYYFDRIKQSFKGAKFIQIVRDGRDVILSQHPNKPNEYWVSPQRWIDDVSIGLKYHEQENHLVIRYEDLTNDYVNTMKTICDFLSLEFTITLQNWHRYATLRKNNAWHEEVKPIHTSSIGRWQDPKNSARVQELLDIPEAMDLLKHYGYA